jgi:phenylacetic acid degradation operon negative regulatory protein
MRDSILPALLADFAARKALKAGAFIVTLYGDVAVARGGALWMGDVIAACALVGLSETLARTAVSRLVEAGRLRGEKRGRRSVYRLTEAAEAEFAAAARALHGPPPEPGRWTLALAPDAKPERMARRGFGQAAPGVWLKPGDAAQAARDAAPRLLLRGDGETEGLKALAAQAWDLAGLSARYAAFEARFAPLAAADFDPPAVDPACALAARLLLVHDFRAAALADPRLPPEAASEGWRGEAARALFAELHARLSPAAEAHVAETFGEAAGKTAGKTAGKASQDSAKNRLEA